MEQFFDRRKELERISGVARPKAKDYFMDAVSMAPMLMGMPPVLIKGGKVIKFPKRVKAETAVAKPNVLTPKQRYKSQRSIQRMEEHYNPDLKNPKVTEIPTAAKPKVTGKSLADELGISHIGSEEGLEWYNVTVPKGEATIATKGVNREELIKKIAKTKKDFGVKE